MENSFQTSFIPKKPIIPGSTVNTGTSSTTSITMVVSVFIFVTMLFAFAGLYLYKNYVLVKSKEALSSNLLKIKGSFDKDTISDLETYDKRTSVARQVLSNHIVLSPLFESLNALTLSSIQYTKFDHSSTKNAFTVKISGIARDYKSISLQADIFNTDKGSMFKDVIFSNLTKDKNNFVTFDLEFDVDPALPSYSNNISNKTISPQVNENTSESIPDTSNQMNSNNPSPEDTVNPADSQLPASNNLQ